MKPDWKDAPEWARYLAMDLDGRWCWFEHEPEYDRVGFWCEGRGRIDELPRSARWPGIDPTTTLEARP
ncbi:hypothetical protein [Xanthomonas phage X2]|nr:hypothetical protein [Xanthomonas phage X2]